MKIDTKSARSKLAVRREPYWDKVRAGCHLGYRRTGTGGSWIARYYDGEKKYYNALELPDHLPPNEYDTAVAQATKWFDAVQGGANPKSGTIGSAADDYLKDLEIRKGAKAKADAEGRIRRTIRDEFGDTRVDKITTQQIRKWLNDFVPSEGSAETLRKAKASANRNLRTFKAILNHAHANQLSTSTDAWDRVKEFPKVDAARKAFLTREQLQSLIDKTAGGFKDLVVTAALTGARYGELCALRVKDFDKDGRVLYITEGKTGARIVPLTPDMVTHFERLTKDKLPEAFLLTKDDGKPWGHSDHDKLMREAAKKAKLPRDVVFYTLRHSFIAFAINAGMDIYSVAEITGTSIKMIEKHYGKLLKDRVRQQMVSASIVSVA